MNEESKSRAEKRMKEAEENKFNKTNDGDVLSQLPPQIA
jgi:hypothetical protein